MRGWWILVLVCAVLSGIDMVWLSISAENAIQQCAGSAMALGGCVVPYVLARAVEGSRNETERTIAARKAG